MTGGTTDLFYLFVVGFFLFAALDMLRRLFDARLSYEQIRPKSVPARWFMVIAMSLALGYGYGLIEDQVSQWQQRTQPRTGLEPQDPNYKNDRFETAIGNEAPEKKDGNLSGMVKLATDTYIFVRDTKNRGPHTFAQAAAANAPVMTEALGLLLPDGSGKLVAHPVTLDAEGPLANWQAPSDLEAICRPRQVGAAASGDTTPTSSFELIVAESSYFSRGGEAQKSFGRLLRLTLSPTGKHWTAKVTGAVALPADFGYGDLNGRAPDRNIESLLCFQSGDNADTYTIIIADRGEHSLDSDRDGALYAFENVRFAATGTPLALRLSDAVFNFPVHAPRPTCATLHEGDEWRDISDLHVTSDGRVWAASVFEQKHQHDRGLMCSKVYSIPGLMISPRGEISLDATLTQSEIFRVNDHKIEALAASSKPHGEKKYPLALGADNEGCGEAVFKNFIHNRPAAACCGKS